MVENFKGCSIQSDKQVDEIVDSKEQVNARNWLRNDSAEQVDVLNDSENLVVDGSDPKSDPSVATHTTNGILATDTTNGISTRKLYPLSIKPATQAVEKRSSIDLRKPKFRSHSRLPNANQEPRYFQSKQLQYRKKGQERQAVRRFHGALNRPHSG